LIRGIGIPADLRQTRAAMLPRRVLSLALLALPACSSAEPPAPTCPEPPSAAPLVASTPAAAPSTSASAAATPPPRDPNIEKLQAEALGGARAFEIVRSLVDEVGPRLAGSPGDKAAVAWGVRTMKAMGLANVRAEKVMVPHWERIAERGEILAPAAHRLALTALGGSVSTPAKGLVGEVVRVESLEALEARSEAEIKGKIVFFSTPTARTRDGSGYGKAGRVRSRGASAAAKKGAIGVVIRSIGTDHDRLPHTGGMSYDDAAPKIPAAALSVPDAELLERLTRGSAPVRISFTLTTKVHPDAESANVIGEVPGTDAPGELVLLGAHLDAWDLGKGAVDDGAGCAAVIDAARILMGFPTRPRRTVRVVLFANEENGLRGAKAYAKDHEAELARHALALEIDLGAGKVHTLRFLTAESARPSIARVTPWLEPLGIAYDDGPAWGGADLIPLRAAGVPLADLGQDATKYFDVHHTANDTLDKVPKEDLDQVVAAVTTLAWAAANAPESFERVPEARRALPH